MIASEYRVSFKCKIGWLIARPGLQRFWELWSSMGALGMGYGNYDCGGADGIPASR